jgi:hypothetical protein
MKLGFRRIKSLLRPDQHIGQNTQELKLAKVRPAHNFTIQFGGPETEESLTMALPQRFPASIRRPTPIYHQRMPIDIAALLFVYKKQDGR